ncbi:RICIN domain-containing protein [Streptomyces chartreusis]|uniref:RICIN domain-containing protein n=1 Tax=Streptomyces chartreusis TaxID=1969 RepID=UPI002F91A07D|nr:RICIN domain-containing protein [Streptomyces chartreusis]
MSDQHRGVSNASATGGASTASSPDAARVEAHLTGEAPPNAARTESAPAPTPPHASGGVPGPTPAAVGQNTSFSGEQSTNAEEETTAVHRPTSRPRSAAGPTSEPEPDAEGAATTASQTPQTSASQGETTTGGVAEEPVSGGRIWGRASARRGRGGAAAESSTESTHAAGETASAMGNAGGDSPNEGADSPGGPRKPLLAGAAMAGAILLAVPLLIMATDKKEDDDGKEKMTSNVADTVLEDDGAKSGAFIAESPSPEQPKDKTKEDSTQRQSTEKATPTAEQQPPKAQPRPSEAEKPKTNKRTAAAAGASSLPTVLTRVLIKNNANGTCVDIPGFSSGSSNGPVVHAECNSSTDDNQLWNLDKKYNSAGPGGVPLFQIRNVMDSLCLDLPYFDGQPRDTRVQEFQCKGTTADNQLWWLDKQSDGKYWIRNFASEHQCLDSYANGEQNRLLVIWPCAPESNNNHEWSITRK